MRVKFQNKISKIKKRDGRIVDFDRTKIENVILKAMKAAKIDYKNKISKITDYILEILNKKFNEKEIPGVEDIQDIVIFSLKERGFKKVARIYSLYRKKRERIRKEKYFLLFKNIKTKLTKNALKVLESRYLRKNEEGKIIETPQQMFQRIVQNIAAAEKIYNPDISDRERLMIEQKFYKLIATLEFLPNSPTLMNAGVPLQQLSACFVLPVEDSLESIFNGIKNAAKIHKSGGGTGFNFSHLRPEGDVVKTTLGIASGPISFMQVFDKATEVIKQGGKRRGANMGILNVDHPDILKFIVVKKKEGVLQNFNISVGISKEFMKALKSGKIYNLINPRNKEIVGRLKAKEVFDLIVKTAWETGDPGVIFLERLNEPRVNPTPKLGKIEATNPCGEQPLLPYESCNLGSINLLKVLKKKKVVGSKKKCKWTIDWKKLKNIVFTAVQFLDNAIDMNRYPLPEIALMSRSQRRLGLGIMGFADMLIKLEIPYDSNKALKLAERIARFINNQAHKKSILLAKKRGVFPNFRNSIYAEKKIKLRNCALTTIAPTGSISIIAGCSQGIEPLYGLVYKRMAYIGEKADKPVYLTVGHPIFEEIAKKEKFYSKKLMEKILKKGTVRGIKEVPKKWQRIFKTAHEIHWSWHVKMQAAFQKYIDNAVSKTINLPANATIEDVKKAYLLAYKLGCRGITIYRSGSKPQQVLNIGNGEKVSSKSVSPELLNPSPDIPPAPPNTCLTC